MSLVTLYDLTGQVTDHLRSAWLFSADMAARRPVSGGIDGAAETRWRARIFKRPTLRLRRSRLWRRPEVAGRL
jgi:hypothetical protein